MDVEIHQIDELLVLRKDLQVSAERGADALKRSGAVLADLSAAVAAEIRRRWQAWQECTRDPDADCRGLQQRYERAEHIRTRLEASLGNIRPAMTATRSRYEYTQTGAVSLLTSLHTHFRDAPNVAYGGSGADAGVPVGALAGAGGAAGGHLPAGAPASMDEVVDEWVKNGIPLNRRIWGCTKGNTPLSADDASTCARLDAAFAATAPLAMPITVNRSCGAALLEDLKVAPTASPATAAGTLASGIACRHPGYVATSTADPAMDASGYRIHMRIHVPEGAHVLDIRSRGEGGMGSRYEYEHEIVLPRDGYLLIRPHTVRAVSKHGALHWFFDADYVEGAK